MKNHFVKNPGLNLALLVLLAIPAIANAQYFTDTSLGDVNAGFRKTGTAQEKFEMVVYLGNFTNFLAVPAGTTINITNYNNQQLTNMCSDISNNLANLQWSVFSSFFSSAGSLTTPFGIFPANSMFYTVPRSTSTVQTTPVPRFSSSSAPAAKQNMLSISSGAYTISSTAAYYTSTGVYNNSNVVLEPVTSPINEQNDPYLMSIQIGDPGTSGQYTLAWGDMGGVTFTFTVENTTPSPFSSPTVSDFYLNVPVSSQHPITDPLTSQTTGNADYIGYFTLNTNGTMTFTRASSVVAPSITAAGASTATNGFSPLQVVFTNSASGTITNYVWNFGNGTIITNTTGASVTNTYTTGGDYTVTLTVYGPGGSASEVLANYVVASPTPKLSSVAILNGKLVLGGTNGPVGVQYRILTATNLTTALANWTPVLTNTVSALGNFGYTNSVLTNRSSFFRLVSP